MAKKGEKKPNVKKVTNSLQRVCDLLHIEDESTVVLPGGATPACGAPSSDGDPRHRDYGGQYE
jgi:hypothetical protein